MVASWVCHLSLLLLAPIWAVDGVLDELDGKCEGTIECLHHAECEPYKEASKQMKLLPKPSCQLKEARQELKGRMKQISLLYFFIFLTLIFVMKYSRRWWLHIGRTEMFEPLFQTGMNFLNHFFCETSMCALWPWLSLQGPACDWWFYIRDVYQLNFSPVSSVCKPPGSWSWMATVTICPGLDHHRSMKLVCFCYPNIQCIGNIIINNVQDITGHCKADRSLAEVYF